MAELEIEDRTRQAVLQLLRTVASPTPPVVLFLDDVQWATTSSLGIVDAIVDDPVLTGLLVVVAYRDHEVTDTPLATMTAGWARRGVGGTTLRLSPLGYEDGGEEFAAILPRAISGRPSPWPSGCAQQSRRPGCRTPRRSER